jgi:hypothetical protein
MLPNGDKYDGNFYNDNFEGEGTYTFSNGDIKNGKWKFGQFINDQFESMINKYDEVDGFEKIDHRDFAYKNEFDEKFFD